jgi:hypothetical protein
MEASPPAAAPADGYTYRVADDPLPAEVASALPAGLARSDLFVRFGPDGAGFCHVCRQGGRCIPLSTPGLRAAGFPPDQPCCVG